MEINRTKNFSDKDIAGQKTAILDLLQNLNNENSEDDLYVKFYEKNDLKEIQKWVKNLSSSNKSQVQQYLDKTEKLGDYRKVSLHPDLFALKCLKDDFPNFENVIETIENYIYLNKLVERSPFKLPAILLSGPPGVGKTEFCKRLSRLMNVRYEPIDISRLEASWKITGLDMGYESGRPGLIWDALMNESISPIIFLDEIDKHNAKFRDMDLGFLLGLLEQSSARTYTDSAIRLPIDASYIQWIAACNDHKNLSEPLLSRFIYFEIARPNDDQQRAVIRSILRDILTKEKWGSVVDGNLDEECMDALRMYSPREIRISIIEGYSKAARDGRVCLHANDLIKRKIKSISKNIGFI